MIQALINRRFWLWRNRLFSSILLILFMPSFIFIIISLPLKNIIRFSFIGISYEIWVFPGLLFIISSLSLISSIYRDYFELRIHGKVLGNISLSPYSKKTYIFSSLVTSICESLLIIFFSAIIYRVFVPVPFDILNILFFIFCLILYNFFLGNLFISIALIIDTLTIMVFATFMLIFMVLFGNGFLFEFSFFPQGLDSILTWQPLSRPFQVYQKFSSTNLIDYLSLSLIISCNYLWILINSYILKRKLHQ